MVLSDPINVLLLVISIIFFILAALVLSKGRDAVNLSFAITPIVYGMWAILDVFFSDATSYILRVPLLFLFLVGPLGILTSAIIIDRSKRVLQDYTYIVSIAFYFILGLLLGTLSVMSEFSGYIEQASVYRSLYNALVILPLMVAFHYFNKVRVSAPSLKTKIMLINGGLLLTSLAQVVNSISYYLTGDFNMYAYLLIIVGLITAMLAFVRFLNPKKPA